MDNERLLIFDEADGTGDGQQSQQPETQPQLQTSDQQHQPNVFKSEKQSSFNAHGSSSGGGGSRLNEAYIPPQPDLVTANQPSKVNQPKRSLDPSGSSFSVSDYSDGSEGGEVEGDGEVGGEGADESSVVEWEEYCYSSSIPATPNDPFSPSTSKPSLTNNSNRSTNAHFYKKKKKKKKTRGEKQPLLFTNGGVGMSDGSHLNSFPEDPNFQDLTDAAESAIDNGVYPERIVQGSSGSYFVKNMDGEKIGVFKPKDEEPYGHLNPKWLKWMHRMCCPCCFGRSCLVPNQGYLSEAGASLVDQKLQLNVVPKTKVIRLCAPTFNYTPEQRAKSRLKQRIVNRFPGAAKKFHIHSELPAKSGSFQTFVRSYRDAEQWIRHWDSNPAEAPPQLVKRDFQLQFERMVCLDYIIRNTDRGNDNWLIRYDIPPEKHETDGKAAKDDESAEPLIRIDLGEVYQSSKSNGNPSSQPDEKFRTRSRRWSIGSGQATTQFAAKDKTEAEDSKTEIDLPRVKVAAIDNGLAFPCKHPDEWRAYPFHWAWLPYAREPFSEETVTHVLGQIDDTDFVADLCADLRKLFRTDPGFDKKIVEDQLSVLRGQIFNLREALRTRKSPLELVQMPPQLMVEVKTKKKRLRTRTGGPMSNSVGLGGRNRLLSATFDPILDKIELARHHFHQLQLNSSQSDDGGEDDEESTTALGQSLVGDGDGKRNNNNNNKRRRRTAWHDKYRQKVQTSGPFFSWC